MSGCSNEQYNPASFICFAVNLSFVVLSPSLMKVPKIYYIYILYYSVVLQEHKLDNYKAELKHSLSAFSHLLGVFSTEVCVCQGEHNYHATFTTKRVQ